MPLYKVTYVVPDYGVDSDEWEEVTEILEFESDLWAEDYAYTRADKCRHSIELLEPQRSSKRGTGLIGGRK